MTPLPWQGRGVRAATGRRRDANRRTPPLHMVERGPGGEARIPPPSPPLDLTPASDLQYRERGRSDWLVVVPRHSGPVRRLETTDGEVIAEQTGA